ncbi:MAG TPA: recombinase family protein [Brevundimonas sp.]|uniref:recombinase family protein n=1 Tax=Brevundimonas sp. TaxID=1871086 RepID=UPI00260B16EA|nr:recombinase family protein [Brevundimonas sp.]HRO33276.1 recombinase family protein [Brevundimonas sp.]
MTASRCAIYTRKSSEEGLDQAFNSLHAQREACEAYVLSQAGEGWKALATIYDDGGLSGGTLQRPALQRLMQDVDRGMIDVVVVYKVDRLTRSLADFAKIVERFDARSVSFVSVTQAFNTTNSMGRLTLNVLLSFAQFEREVTGERIRDKIAASKKKGMWMGGNLPFGYDLPTDPATRALVVNAGAAEQVRGLFARYLTLGSVHRLKAELDAEGVVTAVKTSRSGSTRGGVAWSRGALFHLLRNRVYLGEVTHKGASYPGAHPGIVDPHLFAEVQASLDANTSHRRKRPLQLQGSPLAGKIVDADGLPMTPAIAYGKSRRRYRYYVSQPLQVGQGAKLDREIVRRVPAGVIEGVVMERLAACGLTEPADGWAAICEKIDRVTIGTDRIVVRLPRGELSAAGLAKAQAGLLGGQKLVEVGERVNKLDLIIPGRPVFRGGRTWIATADGSAVARNPAPDAKLVQGLRRAHAIVAGGAEKALAHNYLRQLVRLAFLAPDIQSAIIEGRQPVGLTLEHLVKTEMPLAWSEQRHVFGFAAIH